MKMCFFLISKTFQIFKYFFISLLKLLIFGIEAENYTYIF